MTVSTKGMAWCYAEKRFVTEASDIGIPPGEWPGEINVVSERTGTVKVFKYSRSHMAHGDLVYVDYWSPGLILRIFND